MPASWSEPGAFASLTSLTLDLSNLSGTLPPSWGGNGSFPVLNSLSLGPLLSPGLSPLAGSLPAEWSSPAAFSMLTSLSITNLSITGERVYAGMSPWAYTLPLVCLPCVHQRGIFLVGFKPQGKHAELFAEDSHNQVTAAGNFDSSHCWCECIGSIASVARGQ